VKWWSHEVNALLLVYTLVPEHLALAPSVLLGAVFPDIIENLLLARHRSLHELAIYLALPPVLIIAGAPCMVGFALAAIDHILVDAMTRQGVKVFGKRVRWILEAKRLPDNFVSIILHMALAYLAAGGRHVQPLAIP
jgi:membrane-bound metal-dependent hydrolase YbcI (DUF457 family)